MAQRRTTPARPREELERTIAELQTEIEALKARVSVLEKQLDGSNGASNEALPTHTTTREQATEEIRKLFASGQTLYMSEVADRLSLPDQLVVEICSELREKEELEVDDSPLRGR